MAQYIEYWLPGIQENGLNTAKATSLGSTLAVTGAVTLASTLAVTGAVTFSGGTTITGNQTTTSTVKALSSTATTSGGYASAGFTLGSAVLGIYFGAGAPTISAPQGSLYLCSDGSSTSTRLYVNTTGATAWTGVTTQS